MTFQVLITRPDCIERRGWSEYKKIYVEADYFIIQGGALVFYTKDKRDGRGDVVCASVLKWEWARVYEPGRIDGVTKD